MKNPNSRKKGALIIKGLLENQAAWKVALLGSPVVPFYPFLVWDLLMKNPNSRKKGALIIKGLLENQAAWKGALNPKP